MDAVLARDQRQSALRQSFIWASLLLATQAVDVITTAADQARGTVEAIVPSANILALGGIGFLFAVKLLVAMAAAAGLALAALLIRPEVGASRATFRFGLVAVQAATLGVVWVTLGNVALLSSLALR